MSEIQSLNRIVEIFNAAQNSLVLQQSDLSLQSIRDMVESNSIDISPKYQRRERWDVNKESELIESFLLNIPVPPIYLAEDEYGTYSVIDGKQRVTAIYKFLNNQFRLKNLENFIDLEGFYFSDLPVALSNALKIRPYLRVVTLLRQSDSELKHEVFLRLNKAGVALNPQEIRNVAFRGPFNEMLFNLSEIPFFSTQLNAKHGSKVYQEMGDVQYVLRYFTVQKYWDNFPGNMDKAMDSFMSENYKNSNSQIESQKSDFIRALSFCEAIWGANAFMKPGANKRILQGFYDIEMVCGSLLTNEERENAINKSDKVQELLNQALNDDDSFLESVTQFTSNPRNVKYRIAKFLDILKNV